MPWVIRALRMFRITRRNKHSLEACEPKVCFKEGIIDENMNIKVSSQGEVDILKLADDHKLENTKTVMEYLNNRTKKLVTDTKQVQTHQVWAPFSKQRAVD